MAYKVLAVDDDRDLLRMMVLVLQNAGYEVLPARSGSEALSILGSHLPDVVILDVMMPGISGYDLVRWLRANPVTAAVPVIMLTAKALQQDKAFGFEAGADDYLTKPVSHSELLMRVKSLLRRATVMPAAVGSTSHFIGFLGAKGGVGTTTLAINTASVLLSGEHEAILVDLQPITSALITLNLAAPALPANMTNGNGGVLADANALQGFMVQHSNGLRVLSLPSPWHYNDALLPAEQLDALFRTITALAPFVLVDIGCGLTPLTRRALAFIDRLIVVTEPERPSLELTRSLLGELRPSLNKSYAQIGLVSINRSGGGLSRSPAEMERMLGVPLLGVITPASEVCFQASQHGLPVVTAYPSSIIAEQIRTIASRLQ